MGRDSYQAMELVKDLDRAHIAAPKLFWKL